MSRQPLGRGLNAILGGASPRQKSASEQAESEKKPLKQKVTGDSTKAEGPGSVTGQDTGRRGATESPVTRSSGVSAVPADAVQPARKDESRTGGAAPSSAPAPSRKATPSPADAAVSAGSTTTETSGTRAAATATTTTGATTTDTLPKPPEPFQASAPAAQKAPAPAPAGARITAATAASPISSGAGQGQPSDRSQVPTESAASSKTVAPPSGKPLIVDIDRISPGVGQPRRLFAEEQLEELAQSIREQGIIQPLVVAPYMGGFQLIAGERRLRASKRAGLERVPVVVRDEDDEGDILELALVENLQREDLTALERARAYERLMDVSGMTQEGVAGRVGKSRSAVANTLRLLALPEPVREGLDQGLLSEGHARALIPLTTAASQIQAMRRVVRSGLSVRATEDLVKSILGGAPARSTAKPAAPASDLEMQLTRKLGTKVRFQGKAGKGRIVIDYHSTDELSRLMDTLLKRQ